MSRGSTSKDRKATDMAYQGLLALELEASRRREVIAADAAHTPTIRRPARPSTPRTLDLAFRSLIIAISSAR